MDAPEARLPRIAVTPDEAAIVTGRTRTRIFEALKNGEIAGRKDGKAVVIEISELERWVRSFPTRGRQTMPPQQPQTAAVAAAAARPSSPKRTAALSAPPFSSLNPTAPPARNRGSDDCNYQLKRERARARRS